MVHSDRPDVRAELVVRIRVDPAKVVYQPRPVRHRNVVLLKRFGDTAEALRRNLVVGERNSREWVDNNDCRAGRKQFREVSASHIRSRRALKVEGLSWNPLAVPQTIEERLILDDGSGGTGVDGVVDNLRLLVLEEISGT